MSYRQPLEKVGGGLLLWLYLIAAAVVMPVVVVRAAWEYLSETVDA